MHALFVTGNTEKVTLLGLFTAPYKQLDSAENYIDQLFVLYLTNACWKW